MTARRRPRSGERGSVLLFAIVLVAVMLIIGVAVMQIAGADRRAAARAGAATSAQLCAEAGLQYARHFFGSRFVLSNSWNDYLDETSPTTRPGYRYDRALDDSDDFTAKPMETRGKSNGVDFDVGADLDEDGKPDFWVSIRDDDDERPLAIPDNPKYNNNETVIIRSECTSIVIWDGDQRRHAVIEAVLRNVQGKSGYAGTGDDNQPDTSGVVL